MLLLRTTCTFDTWLEGLRDRGARVRIQARLDRLELGNLGDSKTLGGGISELRVDYGPGYRIYFRRHRQIIVILLCGGEKSTQRADIAKARALAAGIELE